VGLSEKGINKRPGEHSRRNYVSKFVKIIPGQSDRGVDGILLGNSRKRILKTLSEGEVKFNFQLLKAKRKTGNKTSEGGYTQGDQNQSGLVTGNSRWGGGEKGRNLRKPKKEKI